MSPNSIVTIKTAQHLQEIRAELIDMKENKACFLISLVKNIYFLNLQK